MNISLHYFRLIFTMAFLAFAIVAVAQPNGYEFHQLEVNQTLTISDLPPGIPNIPTLGHPDHGSLWIETVNNEEQLVYVPDSSYTGLDSFYISVYYPGQSYVYLGYEVSMSHSLIMTKRDFVSTSIGATAYVNPLDNDSTTTGTLTLHSVSPIYKHGTVAVVGDEFQFTPDPGFKGITHMSYITCNDFGKCEKGVISVLVHGYTLPGSQSSDILTTKEEAVPVLLPYSYYTIDQSPSNGTLVLLEDFAYLYTPNAGFSGQDNFSFELTTPQGISTYSVTAEVMDIPATNNFANDDYAYTPISPTGDQAYSVDIDLIDNDNGNLLPWTVQLTSSPTNGMAWLIGNGAIKYTPHANFEGVDQITYQVANALGAYETATVYITVSNFTPGASSFDLSTTINTPIYFEYDAPILGYSFDPIPGQGPSSGTVTVTSNSVTYTPLQNFSGQDNFSLEYCVASNGNCFQFEINIDIAGNAGTSGGCVSNVSDCFWAGDMNKDGIVNGKDILNLCAIGEVGKPRSGNNTNWFAQFSTDWGNTIVGINKNIKHMDSDGDSLITQTDRNAVDVNYGKRNKVTPQILPTQQNPLIFNPLNFSTSPGDTVVIEVIMGQTNNIARDFSGLTFQMLYNPVLFDTAWIEFDEHSWLGYDAPILGYSRIPFEGKIDVAFTRADETSKSGFGKIGEVKIVVDDLAGVRIDDLEEYTTLSFIETNGLTKNGHLTKLNDTDVNIQINKSDFDPTLRANELNVYPNPTEEYVTISTNYYNPMEEIRIINMMGQVVNFHSNVNTNDIELDVSHLESGMYIIDVRSKEGPITKKLEVLRY